MSNIARAICDELQNASCTIQPRRWDNLLDALEAKEGDVLAASLKDTAATRQKARFTAAYYPTPARFVTLAGAARLDVKPEGLGAKSIGVVAGSAHEAFVNTFFTRSAVKPYPDLAAMMAALRDKEIDLAFGDAITLGVWMNDPQSGSCCAFQGGPFPGAGIFRRGRRDGRAPRGPGIAPDAQLGLAEAGRERRDDRALFEIFPDRDLLIKQLNEHEVLIFNGARIICATRQKQPLVVKQVWCKF